MKPTVRIRKPLAAAPTAEPESAPADIFPPDHEAPQPSLATERRWVVLCALAVLVYQLFLWPIIGLADNGDYIRVTAPLGLISKDQTNNRFFRYLMTDWLVAPDRAIPDMPSSEHLLVLASLWLNISKDGSYDLRMIGAVHAFLFLLALWLALPAIGSAGRGRRFAIYALLLFIFCDVMYVSFLNSFYTDTASFLFLLLSAAAYLRQTRGVGRASVNLGIFAVSGLLLVLSKSQHVMAAPFLVLLLPWRTTTSGRGSWFQRRLTLVLIAVMLMGAFIGMVATVRPSYKGAAYYNVVFCYLLPKSAAPAQALSEMGLDPSWVRFTNISVFVPNNGLLDPTVRDAFLQRVGLSMLLGYYARHPDMAWDRLLWAARDGADQRPRGLGNLPKAEGRPPSQAATSFALWSRLKVALLRPPAAFFLYLLLPVALLALGYRAGWISFESLAGIAACWMFGTSEFLLAIIGDIGETTRHLFLSNTLYDIIFLAMAAMFIAKVHVRRPGSARL